MKYFSICSGIGADKLAFSDLGWECKGFSEIADFPRAILSHYWKDVPLHGDFTKIEDVPTVDLVWP
jgi:DNA (cytosine-5)-methyltransferase 1